MTADPLVPLLHLADVPEILAAARDSVDAALGHRALRRQGGPVAAEVSLRAAGASAALEGHRYDTEAIRDGTVTDPVVQGALRVAGASGGLVEAWTRAPLQVLARLHVLAARGVVADADLGRPVPDPAAIARLQALAAVVAGERTAPPLLRAAVVHGELMALRPFAGPFGVVARAAARLELVAGGFDPRGVVVVEAGHLAREPEYRGAGGAFATGTPDGVRSWLRHCGSAVRHGAAELTEIADAMVG